VYAVYENLGRRSVLEVAGLELKIVLASVVKLEVTGQI